MSGGPARGPGWDEDPARHSRDWPDDAAAPDTAGWARLPATNVDWMDDAEWAARAASDVDEDEPADPELEDGPPDWEGMDAAIAEAREITAAEARDAEYAARMVFDGGFGAVGAAPGRRGPGQPGSSRSFPGEHASPAAAFGSGHGVGRGAAEPGAAGAPPPRAGDDDSYPGRLRRRDRRSDLCLAPDGGVRRSPQAGCWSARVSPPPPGRGAAGTRGATVADAGGVG